MALLKYMTRRRPGLTVKAAMHAGPAPSGMYAADALRSQAVQEEIRWLIRILIVLLMTTLPDIFFLFSCQLGFKVSQADGFRSALPILV